MIRWLIFLPVGALIVYAGYLGWKLREEATVTEILARGAARYLAEFGGDSDLSDCEGRMVRYGRSLVDYTVIVTCQGPEGGTHYFYDESGRDVTDQWRDRKDGPTT